MSGSQRDSLSATLLGITALLLWGSFVAVVRGVREQMGVIQSAAFANLVGGAIGFVIGPMRAGRTRDLMRLPGKYLFGCGGLFVLYNLAVFAAIDKAATHAQTVEVALVNYLWPALAVACTVMVLRKKASWRWLLPGLVIATAGAFWAVSRGSISLVSLREGLVANPRPYVLALIAAVSWALYSTLARRWGTHAKVSAASLFLIATGVSLVFMQAISGFSIRVPTTFGNIVQLAYLTLFPTMFAYVFWDQAMRRGNIVLLTSLSFFVPLVSTLISCVYLGVPMRAGLLIAAGLVVVGAMMCNAAIRTR